MHIQIVTFQLNGVTEDEYRASCEDVVSAFADLPGLVSKMWLRDPRTGTYGGLYLWRDRQSYEQYVTGDIFKNIQDDETLNNVHSRDFELFEQLTSETQPGLAVV